MVDALVVPIKQHTAEDIIPAMPDLAIPVQEGVRARLQ
jgi:hypothetical protein